MIERTRVFPLARQAKFVRISKGTVDYSQRPGSEVGWTLMCRIDELHWECPFAGNRMLRYMLGQNGILVPLAGAG